MLKIKVIKNTKSWFFQKNPSQTFQKLIFCHSYTYTIPKICIKPWRIFQNLTCPLKALWRETDIPLPIDCFYQLAKPGVDEAGNIKWELTENTTDWAANIIKAAPNNDSRDALIRNLTRILEDSIPAPILTSSREVDNSNGAIVATVTNPPREVDTSNGAIVAMVRNQNYSKDMFD